MTSKLWWVALLACVALAVPAWAESGRGLARVSEEKRVALVIGNSAYRHAAPLDNPSHDAERVATTLHDRLGFELVGGKALLDLDKAAMDKAVQDFGRQLRPGVVALFYYAGHGVEMDDNYLIPVDANPNKSADFDFQALKAQSVLRQMQDAGTLVNIVILDACRSNPFKGRGIRAATAGLKSMEAPEGTLIAYAAEEGKTAQDGPPGGNSPYAAALADAMQQRGLGLWETFNAVALQVAEATGKSQIPWTSNSPIKGRFYFVPPEETAAPPVPTADKEQSIWDDIKNSGDAADFKAYLKQFPAGPHAEFAKNRLARLTPAPAPEPPRACADCPEMVPLPGGEFWMGSADGDKEASDGGKPRHRVKVKPFSLGKYEVTKAQYAAFVKDTGHVSEPSCYSYKDGNWGEADWRNPGFAQQDSHLVVCVSFGDAQAYIDWLRQKTGQHYRLPTEAEWEYAARAGTETSRYWGDDPDKACQYANVADQTSKQTFSGSTIHNCSDGYTYTAPIGSFQPNAFKLFDMLGNVLEWTCSAYTQRYNGEESICTNAATVWLALRGGSWGNEPGGVRSAFRWPGPPYCLDNLGFRLAQD